MSSGVIFTNRSFGSANALFPVIILLKYSPASFVVNTLIGLSICHLLIELLVILCQSKIQLADKTSLMIFLYRLEIVNPLGSVGHPYHHRQLHPYNHEFVQLKSYFMLTGLHNIY